MKLLVFAHTPPPHHGQSYMVQLLLEGLAPPDSGIQCFHVNARLSDSMEDIGGFRLGKIFRLLGYCAQAIWLRFRHGVENFYYVPAPAKRNAIYRDWIVLALCRPFFQRTIFHWEATGLGLWAEQNSRLWQGRLTKRLHGRADLSIVLTNFDRTDAEKLTPKRIATVPNGIPDPCPDFASRILLLRQSRYAQRQSDSTIFRVLFLAHCTREKGLFDAMAAIHLAHLRKSRNVRLQLLVAGSFMDAEEKSEFDQRTAEINESAPGDQPLVIYRGFVTAVKKEELLIESDCLCFPSYYLAEAMPVSMVEALAFGLPIITTQWRGLPEIIPEPTRWTLPIQSPPAIAEALLQAIDWSGFQQSRTHFLHHLTSGHYTTGMRQAICASS